MAVNPDGRRAPADLSSATPAGCRWRCTGGPLGWAQHDRTDSSREPACARTVIISGWCDAPQEANAPQQAKASPSASTPSCAQTSSTAGSFPANDSHPSSSASARVVSVNVIREALALLAAQNLIRVERNRGFHETSLSADMLTDLRAARRINEGLRCGSRSNEAG